jgi:hypothetical protein
MTKIDKIRVEILNPCIFREQNIKEAVSKVNKAVISTERRNLN